jgi:hypothetical protein
LCFGPDVLAGACGCFPSAAPAADRFVCPFQPRALAWAKVANGFVAWLKAWPQFNNDGVIAAVAADTPGA